MTLPQTLQSHPFVPTSPEQGQVAVGDYSSVTEHVMTVLIPPLTPSIITSPLREQMLENAPRSSLKN